MGSKERETLGYFEVFCFGCLLYGWLCSCTRWGYRSWVLFGGERDFEFFLFVIRLSVLGRYGRNV